MADPAREEGSAQGHSRPSFSAPFYAALRQGAKELGQALQAFPDGIRVVEEPGTLGNPTPAEVTAEKGTVHGYREMLDGYASRGANDRGREQERER